MQLRWKTIAYYSSKAAIVSVVILIVAIAVYILIPYNSGYLSAHTKMPTTVYDRNGIVLMEIAGNKKGLSQAIALSDVPKEFIQLLLYSEDRDFYHHCGISLKGILRALYQNIRARRIVSGGSTITQQLVKSKREIMRNTIVSKLTECIEALRLELHFSKDEIMQAYINEIYLGNNIFGFEKAALIYFDKHLYQCDLLECAFLISMVRAPEKYNPYKNPDAIVKLARTLLERASKSSLPLTAMQKEIYRNKKIMLQYSESSVCAPLFCLYALSQAKKMFPDKDIAKIYTTMDAQLYKDLLCEIRNAMGIIKDKNACHAACVIIDNTTMEIMAMIGSIDFFDYSKGQIDATLIKKQVASTMKPFVYALALEKGLMHTSSIVPDMYTEFYSKVGNYIPKNFSKSYHGPVRFAKALGCSYNIPAVYVTNKVGVVSFYSFLKSIGFDSINRSPAFYGLGIVLGNAEVTLMELANAYTLFARGGLYRPVQALRKVVDTAGNEYGIPCKNDKRVLHQKTCYLITHILSEYKYKVEAFGLHSALHFPFPFAVKTGTSKDFKDNFVVGYNQHFTCAVWVGNLYNESLDDLPAVSGAGIILKNVLLNLWNKGFPFKNFKYPENELKAIKICTLSGLPANSFCPHTEYELYALDCTPTGICNWHSKNKTTVPAEYAEWAAQKNYSISKQSECKIIFPSNGSTFKIDKTVRKSLQAIPLKAMSSSSNVKWYINNQYIGYGSEIVWQLKQGKHVLCAKEGNNKDYVSIIVLE